jgi:hypothetical protein
MCEWEGGKKKGKGTEAFMNRRRSPRVKPHVTSQYVISLHEPRAQTGILYKALQLMFITRNIKSFANIQNTTKRLPNRYFNTKTPLKMPLVVPGINSGGDNSKTQEWTDKLVGKKIGDSSDAVVRLSKCTSHLY